LTLKVRTVFEKQIINFSGQFAHRNHDEGAACPREAQRSPGYPLQSFCPCCFGLEGKKDFRFYPWPMPARSFCLITNLFISK
jgi:hypothetical protein